MIKVEKTKLDKVLLIKPDFFEDHRGEYVELYNKELYKSHGIDIEFCLFFNAAQGSSGNLALAAKRLADQHFDIAHYPELVCLLPDALHLRQAVSFNHLNLLQ